MLGTIDVEGRADALDDLREPLCDGCPWCHPELVGERILDLFKQAPKLKAVTLPGLKLSRAGGSNPGGLWLADNGAYGESTFFGSIRANGATRLSAQFRALPRAEQVRIAHRLRRLAAFGPAELVRLGQETGLCCYCGAELTDPVSLALGYGPVCSKYHDLPHSAKVAGVEPVKAGFRRGTAAYLRGDRFHDSTPPSTNQRLLEQQTLRERLGVEPGPSQEKAQSAWDDFWNQRGGA